MCFISDIMAPVIYGEMASSNLIFSFHQYSNTWRNLNAQRRENLKEKQPHNTVSYPVHTCTGAQCSWIINSSVTFGQKYILLCKEYLSNKRGENERREQGPETSRAFQMSAKQISTSDGLWAAAGHVYDSLRLIQTVMGKNQFCSEVKAAGRFLQD